MTNNEIQRALEKATEPMRRLQSAIPRPPDPSKLAAAITATLPRLDRTLASIGPNPVIEQVKGNLASEFYRRLRRHIAEFDASLDQAHEVGVRLVHFGQSIVFALEASQGG